MLMRFVLILSVLMIVVGSASKSGFLDRFVEPGAGPTSDSTPQPIRAGGPIVLMAADNGHFFVDASVSGLAVQFVVDTGASSVVLSAQTARRLDIRPAPADFTGQSRTANGVVAYAPVRLPEIRIGALVLRNVDAVVLPEGALDTNLLGMNFLKRLRGFEANGRRMVLTP